MADKQPLSDYSWVVKTPADNFQEAVIEKTGLKVDFTMAQVYAEKADYEKRLKENKGQLVLESAKVENISRNHPFLLELTEQQLFTTALFNECKTAQERATKNIAILQEAIADYEAEIAAINKACDFPEQSPVEVTPSDVPADDAPAA